MRGKANWNCPLIQFIQLLVVEFWRYQGTSILLPICMYIMIKTILTVTYLENFILITIILLYQLCGLFLVRCDSAREYHCKSSEIFCSLNGFLKKLSNSLASYTSHCENLVRIVPNSLNVEEDFSTIDVYNNPIHIRAIKIIWQIFTTRSRVQLKWEISASCRYFIVSYGASYNTNAASCTKAYVILSL